MTTFTQPGSGRIVKTARYPITGAAVIRVRDGYQDATTWLHGGLVFATEHGTIDAPDQLASGASTGFNAQESWSGPQILFVCPTYCDRDLL